MLPAPVDFAALGAGRYSGFGIAEADPVNSLGGVAAVVMAATAAEDATAEDCWLFVAHTVMPVVGEAWLEAAAAAAADTSMSAWATASRTVKAEEHRSDSVSAALGLVSVHRHMKALSAAVGEARHVHFGRNVHVPEGLLVSHGATGVLEGEEVDFETSNSAALTSQAALWQRHLTV